MSTLQKWLSQTNNTPLKGIQGVSKKNVLGNHRRNFEMTLKNLVIFNNHFVFSNLLVKKLGASVGKNKT